MVRPDRHPEFPREIVKYFIRGDPIATHPHGLQNRVRTRSAVSSSLSCSPSLVRSTLSRSSRSEILCFSCPISSNVVICSCLLVRPTPVITRLRQYSPIMRQYSPINRG